MIGQSYGNFLVLPFGAGLLMVLTSAYVGWRSVARKDAAIAIRSAGGLLLGSWFVCCGLGVVPRELALRLSLYAFLPSILLIVWGHLLVNRRQAFCGLALAMLAAALLLISILGLNALGATRGPLCHAGRLVIVFLVAFVIYLVRKRWGGGP